METKNKRIIEVGNGYYVNIPTTYIKDGKIDPKKKYDVTLTESLEESA
jgi:hypothetical protein